MINPLLDALCKKYEGEIAAAKANINVYITNPAGIGEHPNLVAAVDSEIEKLTDATDKLSILRINYSEKLEELSPSSAPNLYP